MIKKIKTEITYRVPAWAWCNLPSDKKKVCRFCIKERGYYRCALHDELLSTSDKMIEKTRCCQRATAGYKSVVEDVPDESLAVDPKELIKLTVDEYIKTHKQLIKQGYPASMADKLAKKFITGGK